MKKIIFWLIALFIFASVPAHAYEFPWSKKKKTEAKPVVAAPAPKVVEPAPLAEEASTAEETTEEVAEETEESEAAAEQAKETEPKVINVSGEYAPNLPPRGAPRPPQVIQPSAYRNPNATIVTVPTTPKNPTPPARPNIQRPPQKANQT